MQKNVSVNWLHIHNSNWSINVNLILAFAVSPSTLPLKSLLPLATVWSKTDLNTGGVGGTGVDPQTWKMGISFLMSLVLRMPIFNNFQWNGALGETLKQKLPLFITIKVEM